AQLFGEALSKEQRRGSARVGAQQFVQALLKLTVPLRFLVVPLQFVERRHQGFGDIASAIDAEASGSGCSHRLDFRCCHLQFFLSACRTASMKARTFFGSFFPGLASTPDATSTPQGFSIWIASATLVEFR